jgi:hypothetical protein
MPNTIHASVSGAEADVAADVADGTDAGAWSRCAEEKIEKMFWYQPMLLRADNDVISFINKCENSEIAL